MVKFQLSLRWWKIYVLRVNTTTATNPFFELNSLSSLSLVCKVYEKNQYGTVYLQKFLNQNKECLLR